jgi:hypothetical protein
MARRDLIRSFAILLGLLICASSAAAQDAAKPAPDAGKPAPDAAKPPSEQLLTDKLRKACEDDGKESADLRLLKLAAALSQTGSHALTDVAIDKRRSGFIPDQSVRTFAITTPDQLVDRSVTTLLLYGTPSDVGDLPAADLTEKRAREQLEKFGIQKLSFAQIQDHKQFDARPSTAAEPATRDIELEIVVPAVEASLGPLWPPRRVTFAVVSCAKKDNNAPDPTPRAYVGTYTVSSHLWTLFNVIVLVVAAYGFAALAVSGRSAGGANAPRSFDRWKATADPVVLTQDGLGFGSTSRLQLFFFMMVVAATLSYALMRTGSLSDISGDLLSLLGIGGVSATATKVIGDMRKDKDTDLTYRSDRWLTRHGITMPPRTAKWSDLVTVEREFDIFKFQSLIFSGIVGFWILQSGLTSLDSLAIPPHVLELLGLSQVLYVGGRLTQTGDGRKNLNMLVQAAIDKEMAFFGKVPTDAPFRSEARLRGLRFSTGQPVQSPDPNSVPPAAMAALQAFQAEAFRVAEVAISLGYAGADGAPLTATNKVWPVDPPDDVLLDDTPPPTT